MSTLNEHLNIVVVGPFQTGKSTFLGHLFAGLQIIDQRTIDRYKRECIEIQRPNCEYAWVFEKTKGEKWEALTNIQLTKGIIAKDSILLKEKLSYDQLRRTTMEEFEKMNISFIDTPGNIKYTKNTIRGIHKGDVAFLVVSASQKFDDQKEAIIEKLILLKAFLVDLVAVIITKMGEVKYSEIRFEETKYKILDLLKLVRIKSENVRFIPIDGLRGDNLTVSSENMTWAINKTGTVTDLLNTLKVPERSRLDTQPFRMTVEDVYKISGVGTVLVGIVESGIVRANQLFTVSPSGLSTKTKSVEMMGNPISEGKAREFVGVNVANTTCRDYKIGEVLSDVNFPAVRCEQFVAQIKIVDDRIVKKGWAPTMNIHLAQVPCIVLDIVRILGRNAPEKKLSRVELMKRDIAIVTIMSIKPVCVETFNDFPKLGTFVLRDNGKIAAYGGVKEVIPWSITSKETTMKYCANHSFFAGRKKASYYW
ncbi:elongation factor 1-alpha, putative [Entamoeba invadens IP1]|uniref:Elongation factor 1-alpha, putative n=1 Tax=Entamoeba invadens IP1 TaxID=370355 RepID=A0A0A1TXJ1_ENTIV|nr:elongation factor 1-alpha, putative [Entamoeba invadens IP1]ELP86065.1 elongation factor 1-alpha, putative [Entamoeba invadens IP1]|eukprot:XP_004185411.1 elongation factor 1-alpha, putative [Entamoeba invadens IP1]